MGLYMNKIELNKLLRSGLKQVPKVDVLSTLIGGTPSDESKLRILRENVFNYARKEINDNLGISASTWKNYEHKYRTPDIRFMNELLKHIEEFFVNQGPTPPGVPSPKERAKEVIISIIDEEVQAQEFLTILHGLGADLKMYDWTKNGREATRAANKKRVSV